MLPNSAGKSQLASRYSMFLGGGAPMLAAPIAHAVQNFQEAALRNQELQELELATSKERDAPAGERDNLDDKYQAKKWQLDAAINNMAQGLIMLDSKANVLVTN